MDECPSLDSLRHSHTPPICTDDLSDRPGLSVAFLKSAGVFDQSWQRSIYITYSNPSTTTILLWCSGSVPINKINPLPFPQKWQSIFVLKVAQCSETRSNRGSLQTFIRRVSGLPLIEPLWWREALPSPTFVRCVIVGRNSISGGKFLPAVKKNKFFLAVVRKKSFFGGRNFLFFLLKVLTMVKKKSFFGAKFWRSFHCWAS